MSVRIKTLFVRRSNEFWRQIVAVFLAWAAGVKSLESLMGRSGWTLLFAVLLSVLGFAGLRFAWIDERKRSPIAIATPEELVEWNLGWAQEQGKMVVITRDMSWVLSDELKELLRKKASEGDLVVIARAKTAWLSELEGVGAQIVETGTTPRVRFTVLRFGASDARVLVHRQNKGRVEFREIHSNEFPAFALCMDEVDALVKEVP